jgi:hypothetical protein
MRSSGGQFFVTKYHDHKLSPQPKYFNNCLNPPSTPRLVSSPTTSFIGAQESAGAALQCSGRTKSLHSDLKK